MLAAALRLHVQQQQRQRVQKLGKEPEALLERSGTGKALRQKLDQIVALPLVVHVTLAQGQTIEASQELEQTIVDLLIVRLKVACGSKRLNFFVSTSRQTFLFTFSVAIDFYAGAVEKVLDVREGYGREESSALQLPLFGDRHLCLLPDFPATTTLLRLRLSKAARLSTFERCLAGDMGRPKSFVRISGASCYRSLISERIIIRSIV